MLVVAIKPAAVTMSDELKGLMPSRYINAWLSACRLRLNAAKTQLLWLGSSQLLDKVDCHDVLVLDTRVAISDTARDLDVVIDRELSLAAHVTAVCRSGYNQLRQLRPVVRSLSMNATKTLARRSSRVAWTTVTHCFMVSVTDFFNAFSRCKTLPLAWSQAPVVATTSHQCCGSCTGCQFVSESRSRSRGSCISRLLVLLRRILLTTVIFCLTLVVAR